MPESTSTRALLANPRFRKLFIARTISNIGNGVAPIAIAFGVLSLPGATPTSLSIVLAAQAIPLVLVLPIGGVVADRLGRAKVIAVTDLVLSAFVMLTAVLFLTGSATVTLLAIIGAISGCLNALWWPAMSSLVPEVVEDAHLQPANAFVSVASNAGLIAGNAIGGVLVALIGSGWAIAVDSVSFIIAGLLVFSIRDVSTPHSSGESTLGDLAHGWRVFWSYRWVVVIVGAFSFVVMVWRGAEEVMGPVLAREVYGGAAGWAFIMVFQSVGLLLGAVVASKLRVRRPLVVGMVAMLTLPLWLVTLALELPIGWVALASFACGASLELLAVWWFTAMQTNIPRDALSRVSAYDAMGSLMFGPIGLAISGPLIVSVGANEAFLIAAAVATAAILGSLLFRSVRQLSSEPASM
ncbi:MAG: MFS transporter [Actinobacteria bacterium]|nr:MFS transporter [Actinomycetota bacterium]